MRRRSLLKTTTFRLALVYLLLFALSSFALLGFIYWTTIGFMARQTDETIEAEITGLKEQFQRRGFSGLVQIIRERSKDGGNSLYLITARDGRKIVGNLPTQPDVPDEDEQWIDFRFERESADGQEIRPGRARVFLIRGGLFGDVLGYLIVGRDMSDRREIEGVVTSTLAWAAALTLALGILGGLLFSRNITERLEAINKTSREIMGGDLSRRVVVKGSGDEMDELARNLNAMLDQIERLMTAMRQVTDNIAHDLRSPLNRLRTRLEVTLMQPEDHGLYRCALEDTIAEADNLLQTFNALLNIARIESGVSQDDMERLDPAELLGDIAELYEPVCEAEGHALVVHIEKTPAIKGNRELLSQALSNLLDNAVKYAAADSSITLSLNALDTEQIQISVTDTGPGIPVQDRERVRDRFVRLEASRSKPGSGLGLSLVSAVARLHGARLELADNDQAGVTGLRASLYVPIPQ